MIWKKWCWFEVWHKLELKPSVGVKSILWNAALVTRFQLTKLVTFYTRCIIYYVHVFIFSINKSFPVFRKSKFGIVFVMYSFWNIFGMIYLKRLLQSTFDFDNPILKFENYNLIIPVQRKQKDVFWNSLQCGRSIILWLTLSYRFRLYKFPFVTPRKWNITTQI